ncbi:MAG TPA: WD40 repeat domain-containing protein [Opitutaceae bacterium]|jgi:WD40 repeat protein|nr:WD40 repeat domain-containing protein [Opitutaceae bacterium]
MNLTKHWTAQLDDYVIDLAWSGFASQISDLKSEILLAAASAAGPVSIFSGADGAKQHELPGHDQGTNCLAWQPRWSGPFDKLRAPSLPRGLTPSRSERVEVNALHLATGGQDGAVKFWDAASGQHTATASLGKAWVEQLAWTPIGSQIPVLRSPGPAGGKHVERGEGGSDLKFQICVAASAGRDFVLLNPDASVRHAFKPAPKTITALAWQPSGGCVAVAYFGGVCLWDADDFIAQKEFPYANGIHALVWSPDNRWLVSGNQDPSVHLWLPEQDQEFHMSGYEGKVKHLAFDHTSRWLATSGGSDACIWDCSGAGPDGRTPMMLPHDAPVCALAFQHSHGLLATASQDGGLVLWSPERKQPLRAAVRMPTTATKLAWSPDDQLLAVGAENGSVFVLKCEA